MQRKYSPWAGLALSLISGAAYAQDSDSDGVPNSSDARPCDANLSAVTYTPSDTGLGTLAFEDQWPEVSDLDFNDVVIRYNLTVRRNAAGVRSVRLYVVPSALGGIFDNGLGWQLPVPASSVTSIRRRIGTGAFSDLTAEGDTNLTVRLSPNLRELYNHQAGVINSEGAAVSGQPLEVEITFANGTQLSGAGAPYDLFIFRRADFGHQIHFPAYAGTAAMRGALFGTGNDGSTTTRRFVYNDGTPFALNLQTTTMVPRERVAIQNLFPNIVQFASSAGASHADFYQSQVVSAQGFAAASATVPADTNDQSCVAPLVATSYEVHNGSVTSIIPRLTSNTSNGYNVSSSSIWNNPPHWQNYYPFSAVDNVVVAANGVQDAGWIPATAPSPSAPQWLQIQFPSATVISEVYLGFYAQAYSGYSALQNGYGLPRRFRIQVSQDGSYWRDVVSVDNMDYGALSYNTRSFARFSFVPVSTRYLRFYMLERHAGTTGWDNGLVEEIAVRYDSNQPVAADPVNCNAIKQANPAATDGVYTIDPDGAGSIAPFQAYCDMTMDGGGWTLISNRRANPSNVEACGTNIHTFFTYGCGTSLNIGAGDSFALDAPRRLAVLNAAAEAVIIQYLNGVADGDDAYIMTLPSPRTDLFVNNGSVVNTQLPMVCTLDRRFCDSTEVYFKYAGTGHYNNGVCSASYWHGSHGGNYGLCHDGWTNLPASTFTGNRSEYEETKLWDHQNSASSYQERIFIR